MRDKGILSLKKEENENEKTGQVLMTGFRKLKEDESIAKSQEGQSYQQKHKENTWGRIFSSIFPFSTKRKSSKMTITKNLEKFSGKTNNCPNEPSDPSEDIFTNGTFEDIVDEDTMEKRLSLVVSEIEQFEREFVLPMRKSASSSNIFKRQQTSHHPVVVNKFYSTQTLCEKFPSSASSVISDYDSGAFSRESTPDFSLMSSLPDDSDTVEYQSLRIPLTAKEVEETKMKDTYISLDEINDNQEDNLLPTQPKLPSYVTENDDNKLDKTGRDSTVVSSTPKMNKKPFISKSESLLWVRTPTVLKRSATSVGFISVSRHTSDETVNNKLKKCLKNFISETFIKKGSPRDLKRSATSAGSRPVTVSGNCSVICRPEVTVNGLRYHVCT